MSEFISDNTAGIHPAILLDIQSENSGARLPYGNDELSRSLDRVFSEVFQTQVSVITTVTGTAANALALSLVAGPINSMCVHENAHVYVDECNAPEMFTGGARQTTLEGNDGKISRQALEREIQMIGEAHSAQPSVVSLTQSTEIGTVYSCEEITSISELAHQNNMMVHMDGARFANALVALDCSPADMTWKVGVDVLSFGATKNGCMAAEAVFLFDRTLEYQARFRQKRAGQLLSKQRFVTQQLLSYIKDDLWLRNARHANSQMALMLDKLSGVSGVSIPDNVPSNMAFISFSDAQIKALQDSNQAGYLYPDGSMRLCTSWATEESSIEQLVETVKKA